MAGVTLAQRDHRDEPVEETPNAGHVGNSRALQMLPYLNEDLNVTPSQRPKRRRAVDNRIVPMVDALDTHHGLRTLMGVVAGPFTERTLAGRFFGYRRYESFHHEIGTGRHRQTR